MAAPNVGIRASSTQYLPKMPVPPLNLTMMRYLKSVKPFLSKQEFQTTENIVQKFSSSEGIGEKLQKLLEAKAEKCESWLAEWWMNFCYLDVRAPLAVHSNPGFVFPTQDFCSSVDQIEHAAAVTAAALDFKKKLEKNEIAQDKMGEHLLDMDQYYNMFGTCRIPVLKRDRLRLPSSAHPSKHIILMHKNHFFKVFVYDDNGPLSRKQIGFQFARCVERSQEAALAVGILTTELRDDWAKARELLSQPGRNKEILEDIETSLFLVCIDGPLSQGEIAAPNKATSAALKMIHGGGSRANSANRWFDKTIQFVIGLDGEVGLTYEHSAGEGPPIAALMDHVIGYCLQESQNLKPADVYRKQPLRLDFEVDDEMLQFINNAKINLDKVVDNFEMFSFTFSGYGKELIKSQNLSPDSFIQMAIQFAFYKLHREPGSHYEAASLRRFINGRTEAIRSCSTESIQFAQIMLDDTASAAEKTATLRIAIEAHKNYANLGVDRHLLGLRMIAADNQMLQPELFSDPAFTRSSPERLLTSQVSAKYEAFTCFGPAVKNGYACCYNPRPNDIIFGVSAYNSCEETSARKLATVLEHFFVDIQQMLLQQIS